MSVRRRLDSVQQQRRHELLVHVRGAERGLAAELDTARRTAIHVFIRDHIAANGYAPTVREIQDAVGLKSPAAVDYQLDRLVEAGVIRRDPTARAIVLLHGPCAHCGCSGHGDGPS
jgi:DNA-binding transcriptional ArsR family regulator